MASRWIQSLIFLLWALLTQIMATSTPALPYIPTTAFTSPIHSELVYVFLEADTTIDSTQLLALNTSLMLQSSNITDYFETVTASLPFLGSDSNSNVSFVPVIEDAGQILVYVGECSTSTSTAKLWRFQPESTRNITNGTWSQLSVSASSGVVENGPGFLSSGFAFQTLVGDGVDATMYIFGGMCPRTDATGSVSSWQANATYTNALVALSPSSTTTASSTTSATSTSLPKSYNFQTTSDSSGPIAEAGFTITSLAPSYSNNSSGIQTQSRNYILLGGHTRTAFLNISQVALYSLPEDSWSYVDIEAPDSSEANTELAIKSTSSTTIDSRSGHSTTLSSDGSYLIICGGWVGDINTAADPQLAILHIGSGFGGDGDWQWEIPTTSGDGPIGDGIYGHSAILLDGEVLMILGGKSIGSSTSKRSTSEPTAYFYNTTSSTWASSYTNPAYTATANKNASSSSGEEKKVGLGAGLGLGLAAILGSIIWYIWYSRKLRRERRERRDSELNKLGEDARRYYFPDGNGGQYTSEMFQQSRGGIVPTAMQTGGRDRSQHGLAYEGYNGHGDSYAPVPHVSYENYPEEIDIGTGGAQFSIPRKALHSANARGYYQPAPAFEPSHGRTGSLGTSGVIHPIYEDDEDAQSERGASEALMGPDASEHTSRPNTSGGDVNRWSDPFRDQSPERPDTGAQASSVARSVASPTPDSAAREREKEIREWVSDWELAAETMMNTRSSVTMSRPQYGQAPMGRLSPSRAVFRYADDESRTGSNLSDRSATTLSGLSVSRSGSNRQPQQRSNSFTRILTSAGSLNIFSGAGSSTLVDSPSTSPAFERPGDRGMHVIVEKRSASSSGEESASSFQTAHTSPGPNFPILKTEGDTLLPPPTAPAIYYASADNYESGSPSKSKPYRDFQSAGKVGFLGSLRRAFQMRGESPSPTRSRRNNRSPSFSDRSDSPGHAPLMSGGLYGTSGNDGRPRRTVSAGAMLFRRKQGKSDWELDEPTTPGARTVRENYFPERPGNGGEPRKSESEDWDIEKAVENRVVQVMFTVPKEKLRVVNHDIEAEAEEETHPNATGVEETQIEPTTPNLMAAPTPVLTSVSPGRSKVRDMVDFIESRSGSPVSHKGA